MKQPTIENDFNDEEDKPFIRKKNSPVSIALT